jgi:hypothetical protein
MDAANIATATSSSRKACFVLYIGLELGSVASELEAHVVRQAYLVEKFFPFRDVGDS